MKIFLLFCLLYIISLEFDSSKILIIYFSYSGNTEAIVNYIKEIENIPSYKIEPVNPYPELQVTLELAKTELNNSARPDIKDPLTNISQYNTILLGYPLWHKHLPCIVMNQLEKLDFTDKTIYPFNTYGSSGIAESVNDIKKLCPGEKVKDGLPIKDTTPKIKDESVKIIKEWLDNNFSNSSDTDDKSDRKGINNDHSLIIKINYLLLVLLLIFQNIHYKKIPYIYYFGYLNIPLI